MTPARRVRRVSGASGSVLPVWVRRAPLLVCGAVLLISFSSFSQSPDSPPSAPDAPGVKPFAPGVRIDWPNLTVEVDARIALREGPIELLACSPKTKEHESILVVSAQPTHIYQAIGLIGLEPGSPPTWDELNQRWNPARGAELDVRIRDASAPNGRTVSADDWVAHAKRTDKSTPPRLAWVFAGSAILPDGRFAADIEGTVASVVDFETSLLALAATHTSNDDELWLATNTEAIPPRGTKCALLIRGRRRPPVTVDLRADGSIEKGDRRIELSELLDLLRSVANDPRPAHLRVCREAGTSEENKDRVLLAVKTLGPDTLLELSRPPCRFDETPRSAP